MGLKAKPPQSVDVMCKRSDEEGYDVAVFAQTEAGPLEVGIALDEKEHRHPTMAIFLNAPRMGKMVLALSFGPDGKVDLSSVARQRDSGEKFTQELSQDALKSQLTALELQLVQAKKKALAMEEKALARAETDKSMLDKLSRQNEDLSGRLAFLERELAVQKEVATALQRELHPKMERRHTPMLTSPFDLVAAEVPPKSHDKNDFFRHVTAPYALEAIKVARTVTMPDLEAILPDDIEDTEN